MSDVGGAGGRGPDAAFAPRTIALLLVVGILGFVGSLVLGAFAPDLRSGQDGGAHALSDAATGYAGLVRLARATGRNPRIVGNEKGWDTEDLVVATPGGDAAALGRFMAARRNRATLIVLPKWATVADDDRRGWVNVAGLLPAAAVGALLAPRLPLAIGRHRSGGAPLHAVAWARVGLDGIAAPRPVQVIASARLTPILVDARGGIVLGRAGLTNLYVLADPDLLANHGIARLDRARGALAILDLVNATGAQGMAFDVGLNGLRGGRSPLRLAFQPPFLPMTIALAATLALLGWQASVRFGAARPPVRALPFGKAALVDNSAMLVRKAGREAALGPRYAATIRDRARTVCGVPAHLPDDAADAYLDRLPRPARFTALLAAAGRARHRDDMLVASRALNRWLWEKTG